MASNVGTTFVVGKDYQAVLIAPNGSRIDLTNLTDFDIRPIYKMANCDPLNQPPARRALPAGHEGTFNIDRKDPVNDLLFTSIEAGWWNSGSADSGTGSQGSLTIVITEVGGGQSVEQYSGLSVWLSNKGSVKQDSPTKQTVSIFASQKVA